MLSPSTENFLQIYATLPETRTLGPFLRFGLWVQGCLHECPGCMTPDARPLDGGESIRINDLAKQIISDPRIQDITISGGEPFLQAGQLCGLIDQISQSRRREDMGIIVYTGYTLDELHDWPVSDKANDIKKLLDRIDLLIDGRYVQELNDGLSLRGSSNQIVHQLTDRYTDVVDNYYGQPQRKVELHLLEDEIFLAGIPGSDALEKWKKSRIMTDR